MDKALGWVFGFLMLLAAVGFVVNAIIWVVANFWWVLLLGATAGLVVWRLYCHPGVRAKREIKAVVKQGNDACAEIDAATAQAKAEMNRIAREWKNRR